jgi:hypothetical protein
MKFQLKGRRFDTIEEIQAESQGVLDTLAEKDGGTGVYMREGTTSQVMAADRPYGEFWDFYSVSPEYFGYHHVVIVVMLCYLQIHLSSLYFISCLANIFFPLCRLSESI